MKISLGSDQLGHRGLKGGKNDSFETFSPNCVTLQIL